MNTIAIVRIAFVVSLILSLAACASKPEPRQPGVDINLGPFGPRIQISGIDHNDSTPVGVDIDR